MADKQIKAESNQLNKVDGETRGCVNNCNFDYEKCNKRCYLNVSSESDVLFSKESVYDALESFIQDHIESINGSFAKETGNYYGMTELEEDTEYLGSDREYKLEWKQRFKELEMSELEEDIEQLGVDRESKFAGEQNYEESKIDDLEEYIEQLGLDRENEYIAGLDDEEDDFECNTLDDDLEYNFDNGEDYFMVDKEKRKVSKVECSSCEEEVYFEDFGVRPIYISCNHCGDKGYLPKKDFMKCPGCNEYGSIEDNGERPQSFLCFHCNHESVAVETQKTKSLEAIALRPIRLEVFVNEKVEIDDILGGMVLVTEPNK